VRHAGPRQRVGGGIDDVQDLDAAAAAELVVPVMRRVAGHGDDLRPGAGQPVQPRQQGGQGRGPMPLDAARAVGDLRHRMDEDRHMLLVAGGGGHLDQLAQEIDRCHRTHPAQDADQPRPRGLHRFRHDGGGPDGHDETMAAAPDFRQCQVGQGLCRTGIEPIRPAALTGGDGKLGCAPLEVFPMSSPAVANAEIRVTLPDGSTRTYPAGSTGADVAASIGAGLARAALAIRLDGELKDLATPITRDARIEIVTLKDRNEAEVLELLRHDGAHVMAQAVQELYPGTQITFGPATEDGFYYDFVRDEPFTPEDFAKIEQRMVEIVKRDLPIRREEWTPEQAVEYFKSIGETYKAEWVAEIAKRGEPISIYRQGDSWLDLCVGPHLPSTGKLPPVFKLMKVSGAYWRGDAKNRQLQRICATAWRDQKELDAYLKRLEEAEKRDHRRLGREMGLFHQQEEAAGMVFWHPKGWTLYRTLERYMRQRLEKARYQEVKTPQLVDRKLWEASGHWEKFRESMYIAENEEGIRDYAANPGERIFALKPMNCPCHVQIFNQGLKSYRDLPLRMAEFGSCHRFEPG